MSNGIKQGDKVKVSGHYLAIMIADGIVHNALNNATFVVDNIDRKGRMAYVSCKLPISLQSPIAYLIKVDAEAKERKIKLGDMVRVKGNLHEPFSLNEERHLEIANIPPRAVSQKEWKVIKVEIRRDCTGRIYTLNNGDSFIHNIPEDCVELIEPKAETDANEQLQEEYVRFMKDCMSGEIHTQSDFLKDYDPSKHEVSSKPRYAPEIMSNTEFWVKYEADLAKELAIAYGKRGKSPLDAVAAAKEITKRLKQK